VMKKIGDIIYELYFFEGNNKYIIYKLDKDKMKNGCAHRISEVAAFNNKKKALDYLEKLKE